MKRILFFIFLFLLSTSSSLKSQPLLIEGFEGYYPPSGWSSSYSSLTSNWIHMPPSSGYQYAGQRCIATPVNGTFTADSWLFSPSLNLISGVNYRLSFWYKGTTLGRTEKLKVTIGQGQTSTAQTTVIHDYSSITNTTYLQAVDVFTVPSNGVYNFALNGYSPPGGGPGLMVDSLRLELVSINPCTGTPPAGTISGLSTVCSGTPFVLTLSGLYNTTTLQFQWQSSPPGLNTFTDIAGANSTINTFTQTSSKDYRCKITCVSSGQTTFSPAFLVETPAICYCTPPPGNCISAAGNFNIDSVSFSSIAKQSGCQGNGYTNYIPTVPAATIQTGTIVPLFVRAGTNSSSTTVLAGIDFNQNGVFELTEVVSLTRSGFNHTASVQIPFSALTGTTRLRIGMSNGAGGNAIFNCGQPDKGETEDYAVTITTGTASGPFYSYYVNATATGINSGQDWANAYTSLNPALTIAHAGDTIKVAKGTYIPSGNNFGLKDSLVLLGGYPNTGNPTNADRNWATNQTILSGSNNRQNVIVCNNNLTPYTQVNGFIIENGYADNNGGNPVNPGVGMSISNAHPTILNCVFRNNKNFNDFQGGSSVYCNNSNSKFINCFFLNNQDYFTGSIYCKGTGSPSFTNCVFYGNKSNNTIYSTQASPVLTNCTFVNNKLEGLSLSNPRPASIYLTAGAAGVVSNSIFYENKVGQVSDSTDIILNSSTCSIANTITQVYNPGSSSLVSLNPKFVDTANVAGPDNLYFTNDDGLQLKNPCSPAVNIGSNATIATQPFDITGRTRIFESTVDLGAYEVQSALLPTPSVIYVKASATGLNNGTSWANAYTSIQSALQSCSDTIKVAAGTYYPSVNNKYSAFWPENRRLVLGGYPNTGNPTNIQRDPILNPTILSGSIPSGGGESSVVILRGRNIDSTSIIDGLIIMEAKSRFTNMAAIYLTHNGSPVIKNCTIKNNSGGNNAAAMTILSSSKTKIISCLFDNNGHLTDNFADGGAVYVKESTPLFSKCTFRQNGGHFSASSTFKPGGAIRNDNANSLIDSCSFTKNSSTYLGGAIANYNSNPQITNCRFFGNFLESSFGNRHANDIYNYGSGPLIKNCLFSDSSSADYGGAVANESLSNVTYVNCEFSNSKALLNGGASYNDNSTVFFDKCLFTGCTVGSPGASIITGFQNTSCTVTNSTAFSNTSPIFIANSDGAIKIVNSTIAHNQFSTVALHGGVGQLTITNSIFWENIKRADIEVSPAAGTTVVVNNSLFQYYGINGANGNLVGINPRLIDITNPKGPDNIPKTTDDGFVLCSCSPAINKGVNAAISGYNTDLLNNPRVFGSLVDMGAYEFQSTSLTMPGIFYVRQNSAGANDGQSWVNAYTDLQKAVRNSCADTIKIAMGVYKPASASRDSSFFINHGIHIYGGYPDLFAPDESLRNPELYPSVISGEIGPLSDTTDNIKSIMQIYCPDTTVHIDGLTFTRGFNESGFQGSAIRAQNNKRLIVKNCLFTNNYGNTPFYSDGNNLEIDKCQFSENGTISVSNGTLHVRNIQGKALIKNSLFYNNTSNLGGAVYLLDSARFVNCIFYGNKAAYGAGAYLDGNPSAKFINCTFNRNNSTVEYRGTDLYKNTTNNPSAVIVRNTVFKDQLFNNISNQLDNSDWYQAFSGPGAPPALNVYYCVTRTGVPGLSHNISPNSFTFSNPVNLIGSDNRWFTADDGLQPSPCTSANNNGDNSFVQDIPFDITGSPRIKNTTVDMGAYESQGAAVSIQTTDTLVCAGSTVTFTATPYNGGTSPVYQWKVNGVNAGTNSDIFSTNTLNNGDQVMVVLSSSETCLSAAPASSNVITIHTLSSIPVSVTISSSASTICQGTPVTFLATPINAGSSATYQWQINGVNTGSNSNTLTASSLTNGAQVKVIVTSSHPCASPTTVNSNTITMTVNSTASPAVSVAASSTNICTGASVTFTATPTNGGTSPSYQWQVNGVNAGTNSNTFTSSGLANNDQVKVILTSNASCITTNTATSNTIVMTINSTVTPAVSVVATSATICSGTSVTFTATPTNGGTNPAYQWQVNGVNTGTNSSTFTSTSLASGDQVKVTLTSSATCTSPATATSNTITMTVNNTVLPIISITGNTTVTFGQSSTITTSITNGGTTPGYQWQDSTSTHTWQNITGANSNSLNYTPAQTGDKIRCILTSNASCANPGAATSNVLSFVVTPITAVNPVPGSNYGIRYFPNPVNRILYIDSLKISDRWQTLEIISMSGLRLLQSNEVVNRTRAEINVERLVAGQYILVLRRKNGEAAYFKFIRL